MKKSLSLLLSVVVLFSCLCIGVTAEDNKGYIVVTDTIAANSGEDVADKIQALIDANPNRTIFFPDGEYLVSKPIYTPAEPRKSVSLEMSDFAVIKAIGDWTYGEAVIQLGGKDPANDTHTPGSNYSLEGGIIDGNGVANGISINSGRETAVRDTSIKNTVVGLHIMHGANNGSSDADITGINIIGTGKTDSVGILLEGFDNTVTNVRIGHVFIGVHVNSAGNILRNVHPVYYSDYTDYQNSCGFLVEKGNNWFDYCYSDQFAVGFRTTWYGVNTFHDCFCYWYSAGDGTQTAFKADAAFDSVVTNFNAGFHPDAENCIVLSVGAIDGEGSIENLTVDEDLVTRNTHKAYLKDAFFLTRWLAYFDVIIDCIMALTA
ncbi:MAG: hypothetical protein J6A67_06465 [Clostridia bacterium]|nr:hypothetical protein [Clostridia bacterium]